MANLYGVANAPGLPLVVTNLGSTVVVPASTITGFYTSPAFVAPSNGYFYVMVWCNLVVASGAAINTGMQLFYAIGGGSNVGTASMGAYGLVANTTSYIPVAFATAASQVPWQGAGSTVTLSINAAGQGITLQPLCNLCLGLFRAPDQ